MKVFDAILNSYECSCDQDAMKLSARIRKLMLQAERTDYALMLQRTQYRHCGLSPAYRVECHHYNTTGDAIWRVY